MAPMKYHHSCRPFTYSVRMDLLLELRRGLGSVDQRRRQCQLGSLTGAVHLSNDNAGVLRRTQRGRKPLVEQKGKCPLDLDLQYGYRPRKRGLSILLIMASVQQEVSEKLPQG